MDTGEFDGDIARAGRIARVRAAKNRSFAQIAERKAGVVARSSVMYRREALRLRLAAGANDAEARSYERSLADLRAWTVSASEAPIAETAYGRP